MPDHALGLPYIINLPHRSGLGCMQHDVVQLRESIASAPSGVKDGRRRPPWLFSPVPSSQGEHFSYSF